MFTVNLVNQGQRWYLRGTTWTSDGERASQFKTDAEANAALKSAHQFMKPALRKLARIQPAPML